jgi:hypothetical protein
VTAPEPLPGIDDELLAAGEHDACMQWLMERSGLSVDGVLDLVAVYGDLDTAVEVVQQIEADCGCDDCLALAQEAPMVTLQPRSEFL